MASIKSLLGLLHNSDYHMRLRAVRALGLHTSQHAIELLLEHLGEFDPKDEESKVNRAASLALANIGDLALEPLIQALAEKQNPPHDDWRRVWIVNTLGLIKDVRAVEVLIEALQDEAIRGCAAEALARIGDTRALEPLIHILPQSKAYAAIAVREAIKTLEKEG